MKDLGGLKSLFAGFFSTTNAPTTPPMIAVAVSGDGTPTAGQNYTLTCSISGASVTIPSSYQWGKDGTILPERGPTLSFSPLRLFNAGEYTCWVSVNGTLFNNSRAVALQSQ